jgi:hypothetical protein
MAIVLDKPVQSTTGISYLIDFNSLNLWPPACWLSYSKNKNMLEVNSMQSRKRAFSVQGVLSLFAIFAMLGYAARVVQPELKSSAA